MHALVNNFFKCAQISMVKVIPLQVSQPNTKPRWEENTDDIEKNATKVKGDFNYLMTQWNFFQS